MRSYFHQVKNWHTNLSLLCFSPLKFMFSKKATKIDEIFTVDFILCSKCQIDGEDFVKFVVILENTNFTWKNLWLHLRQCTPASTDWTLNIKYNHRGYVDDLIWISGWTFKLKYNFDCCSKMDYNFYSYRRLSHFLWSRGYLLPQSSKELTKIAIFKVTF